MVEFQCLHFFPPCFSLKTSFLKWKPDYELAADSYTKAATCFKNAKELVQCRDCLYKAADCYKQTKSYPFSTQVHGSSPDLFFISIFFYSGNIFLNLNLSSVISQQQSEW